MSKYYILLLVLTFFACEQDIELDLEISRDLVVLGSVSPGRRAEIRLGTTSTSNQPSIANPKNGTITISENGESLGVFKYVEESSLYFFYEPLYIFEHDFLMGKTYDISASLPGFEDATSTTTIPDNIPQIEAELEPPVLVSEVNGSQGYSAKINMKQLVDMEEDALYHVKVEVEIINQDITYRLEAFTYSDGLFPIKDLAHESGFIFRGQDADEDLILPSVLFDFGFFPEIETKGKIFLEVRQVSQEYFDFHNSVADQEVSNINEGLLTQQASNISNNIVDGIGMYGSYTSITHAFDW